MFVILLINYFINTLIQNPSKYDLFLAYYDYTIHRIYVLVVLTFFWTSLFLSKNVVVYTFIVKKY